MMLGQEVEAEENYEIAADAEFPFACFICRGDFVQPCVVHLQFVMSTSHRTVHLFSPMHSVVTKCTHYFCQKCALQHFAKSSKCFICKEATQGIFNTADKLIKHLALLKSKAATASSTPAEAIVDSASVAAAASKKSGSGWIIP